MFQFNSSLVGIRTFTPLALSLTLLACGIEEGNATLDTETASGTTEDPELPECSPFDTQGQGYFYACEGQMEGHFNYNVCDTECDNPESEPLDGESGDGNLPFPPDTSETEGDGIDLDVCCTEAIEEDEPQGDQACLESCTSALCTRAIERLDELMDDSATIAFCNADPDCEANVINSLHHYRTFIHQNFGDCMMAASNANTSFMMGLPGCGQEPSFGCLVDGVLDLDCSAGINVENQLSACVSVTFPAVAPASSQSCTIDLGGGRVRDSQDVIDADFTGGSAVIHTFACDLSPCPLVLEGLTVTIEDFEGDGYDLTNLEAELYIAAYGVYDGPAVDFPAGAIQIRVTGDADDGSSVIPFDVVGASSEPAMGEYDDDELILWEVTFEAGGYHFTASVDESSCTNL